MPHTLIPYAPGYVGGSVMNRSDSRHLRQLSLGLGQPRRYLHGAVQIDGADSCPVLCAHPSSFIRGVEVGYRC